MTIDIPSICADPNSIGSSVRSDDLSKSYSFDLELVAEADTKIEFDKVLGQVVTVKIVRSECPDRYFHGIVSSFAQGPQLAGQDGNISYTRYLATIVPSIWFLRKRIQSRIFQQMT